MIYLEIKERIKRIPLSRVKSEQIVGVCSKSCHVCPQVYLSTYLER
jgi:hypothetical protein